MLLKLKMTALRLKKDYLALVMLGAMFILGATARNWISLTRGALGLPGIPRLMSSNAMTLAVYIIITVASYIVLRMIVKSKTGLILQGIRDDELSVAILGRNIFAMLLLEKYFSVFNPNKGIADTKKSTEVLTALHFESRAKVDEIVRKAVAAGGATYKDPDVHGDWMYGHGFEDPDHHRWEVFHMDESKMPKNP